MTTTPPPNDTNASSAPLGPEAKENTPPPLTAEAAEVTSRPKEDRRRQNNELRQHIGENVILSKEERSSMLGNYFKGLLGIQVKDRRQQKDLRKVLGEQKILEEEERKTLLQGIKMAVQKFFDAGIRFEKKPSHVEKLGLQEKSRSFLDRIGRGR